MRRVISSILCCLMVCFCLIGGMGTESVKAGELDKPYVEIDSYSIDGGAIILGGEFTLNLVLRNTSKSSSIGSIMATIKTEDDTVTPIYGESDQFYVKGIKADGTETVSVRLQASKDITAKSAKLLFSFSYADNMQKANMNNVTLYLPISTSGTLDVDSISIAEQVSLGAKIRVSTSYENVGTDEIKNIVLHVECEGREQTFSFDSLAGGERSYEEVYLDNLGVGIHDVKVFLSYQGKDGNNIETEVMEHKVSVSSKQVVREEDTTQDQMDDYNSFEKYAVPVLLVGMIIVLFIILLILRGRERK